jgi:hypothetical protein
LLTGRAGTLLFTQPLPFMEMVQILDIPFMEMARQAHLPFMETVSGNC